MNEFSLKGFLKRTLKKPFLTPLAFNPEHGYFDSFHVYLYQARHMVVNKTGKFSTLVELTSHQEETDKRQTDKSENHQAM